MPQNLDVKKTTFKNLLFFSSAIFNNAALGIIKNGRTLSISRKLAQISKKKRSFYFFLHSPLKMNKF
jgi:hypothetical protein